MQLADVPYGRGAHAIVGSALNGESPLVMAPAAACQLPPCRLALLVHEPYLSPPVSSFDSFMPGTQNSA